MQRITHGALQPAPVHPVIGLRVADQRLDRLASFQQTLLMVGERLVLAAVDDLHARVVRVHAPVAEVDDHLLRTSPQVLHQIARLLELGAQNVAVVRVAGEAARAHHQALLVRHHEADLHAELVGVAGLALGDALHLRRVQRVELVLAVALLGADALGTLQPHRKVAESLRIAWFARRYAACSDRGLIGTQLALHLAHHHAENGALALDGLAQALELLGVGIAAGLAAQRLAFLGVGLLARDAGPLGSADHLVTCDLQQPAVDRVRDGLGLHGAVDESRARDRRGARP